MKVVRTHNSKTSTYLKPTISFSLAACEYNSAMTLHFSSDCKLNGAELRSARGWTRGSSTNTDTINFLSPQSYKYRKYWAFMYCWFLAYFEIFSGIKMRLYQLSRLHSSPAELELGYPHMPHGVVHTCCLCLMLRLKEVNQPRLISPSLSSLLFAPSKGRRSEQSQTWEGSEPIHIKFSFPSHAWEVLKYFLKYSWMHGVRIMGSTWLSTEKGKKCRHCEVQTRHSDLDSNDRDTGHKSDCICIYS